MCYDLIANQNHTKVVHYGIPLNNNTESRKNKHLNFEERMTIQICLKDDFTPYKITKELGRSISTTTQIIQGKKFEVYLADTDEANYLKNHNIPVSICE